MNNQHEQAGLRQKLFRNTAERQGATVLPGCWGGDYNADQLALYQNESSLVLLLGLKVTDDREGTINLDTQSLGPYMQLSLAWINAMSQCLRQSPDLVAYSEKIDEALARGALIAAVMVLAMGSQQVDIIRVGVV
ncbi:hypothetical protein [Jeongeupia chitinilytica]|uniref:Uncharacterized protein n=1 Tax=Jeongeupia chitinilytica TaxID=1041641 RepID=A0ABQ3GVZ0_9NEIS|nr:hypothetical protein [Jeongeupia chitinilytica]GHD57869.1 hypothetical protein GCM10007350_06820 [Jeongeupia chitinilytica]